LNNKRLHQSFEKSANKFYIYIENIKKNMVLDIYSVVNTTIITNPYTSSFPKNFFLNKYEKTSRYFSFIKHSYKFYIKTFYVYFTYLISFILFKLFYKKRLQQRNYVMAIDTFLITDTIIKNNIFEDPYFKKIYPLLQEKRINYIFLPRVLHVNKNPFKLIKLFKILNKDSRNFLFEYEMLTIFDFFTLFFMIMLYPFKTLRLIQEDTKDNTIFNAELINDISKQQFETFSRYIYGKNIAKMNSIKEIYSWGEFQVIERAFNFGIRSKNKEMRLNGCQFYLTYPTYFSAYIYDIDDILNIAYHRIFVNGKYNLQKRKKVQYLEGVSFRYENLFDYQINTDGKNIVLLGSYFEDETRNMLLSLKNYSHVIFKSHPILPVSKLKDIITDNFDVVDNNIYELFKNANIVVATASGTCVEAASCGISVLVIASSDNLTANPMAEYGKGEIWDIAYNNIEVKEKIEQLSIFRNKNKDRVLELASWYKENFFIKPSEENIIKVFNIENNQ